MLNLARNLWMFVLLICLRYQCASVAHSTRVSANHCLPLSFRDVGMPFSPPGSSPYKESWLLLANPRPLAQEGGRAPSLCGCLWAADRVPWLSTCHGELLLWPAAACLLCTHTTPPRVALPSPHTENGATVPPHREWHYRPSPPPTPRVALPSPPHRE